MSRCKTCHHHRTDAQSTLGPYWCALQRLCDPNGLLHVQHRLGDVWRFDPVNKPQWSVTRSNSPGPVEGWSKNFRTGMKEPHQWNACAEYSPRVNEKEVA